MYALHKKLIYSLDNGSYYLELTGDLNWLVLPLSSKILQLEGLLIPLHIHS